MIRRFTVAPTAALFVPVARSFIPPPSLISAIYPSHFRRPTTVQKSFSRWNEIAAAPAGALRCRSALFSSAAGDDTTIVELCRSKISAALETDEVVVKGAFDDPNGSHIAIEVVSEKFEGKRMMARQQLVYKAIWEEMQGAVHAVDSMVCKTPSEV